MKKKLLNLSKSRGTIFPRISQNVIAILLLFTSTLAFAIGPGFEDDVNDEAPAAASIDSDIIILTSMGIGLGIYFRKKNETTSKI